MENILGTKLADRYLIEELVGVGGMCNVYRSRRGAYPLRICRAAVFRALGGRKPLTARADVL